jgi:hypothetical protein
MHYEINVSLHGRHFFATAPRSCSMMHEADEVFRALVAVFRAKAGYAITVTYYEGRGEDVTDELRKRLPEALR